MAKNKEYPTMPCATTDDVISARLLLVSGFQVQEREGEGDRSGTNPGWTSRYIFPRKIPLCADLELERDRCSLGGTTSLLNNELPHRELREWLMGTRGKSVEKSGYIQ